MSKEKLIKKLKILTIINWLTFAFILIPTICWIAFYAKGAYSVYNPFYGYTEIYWYPSWCQPAFIASVIFGGLVGGSFALATAITTISISSKVPKQFSTSFLATGICMFFFTWICNIVLGVFLSKTIKWLNENEYNPAQNMSTSYDPSGMGPTNPYTPGPTYSNSYLNNSAPTSIEDIETKLQKLNDLKANSLISQEEYDKLRKDIIKM